MTPAEYYKILKHNFLLTPTIKQESFFEKISHFILSENQKELFILKGFAGTGKTTVIATLVNHLDKVNKKYVLLAPTGRAAKVIANYSKKPAFTIHKKIYFPKKSKNGSVQFTLQQNKHTNTIFIVDEASMISDSSIDGKIYNGSSLLDDVMTYVYSGKGCKLIFMGDAAQLPPVQLDVSPALDEDMIRIQFDKNIQSIEFDEVMRQDEYSGILWNATLLRTNLYENIYNITFKTKTFKDIISLNDGNAIQEAIINAYEKKGIEETTFILRTNKRANQYNQQIRNRILFKESELAVGDYLMVVKNNYFWLKETDEAGFIANGDIIEVLSIYKFIDLYGFKFAKIKMRMIDYPNMRPIETIVLLDTLFSESPSLTYEESNILYQEVLKDYDHLAGYKKLLQVKNNEYFNALQVKFAYAITCHKSQGGQWNTVFLEQPYLPNGIDKEYLRWLYTAITRAKEKLYLIGFKEEYFEKN